MIKKIKEVFFFLAGVLLFIFVFIFGTLLLIIVGEKGNSPIDK